MLSEAKNAEVLPQHLEYVNTQDARDALMFLVGAAATDSRFQCHGTTKGVVRDFRYYDASGKQPYAFIVNRESLLFYFRTPAVESGKHDFRELQALFTEVNQNNSGEWTVRIADLAGALKLSEFLQR